MFGILLLLLVAAPGQPITPADELRTALDDARKLGGAAGRTRYLSLAAIPETDRDQWSKLLNFWANSLSREADVSRLRYVSPTLLSLTLDQFGWSFDVWEKLGAEDPFFHVQILQEVKTWPGGTWPGDGRHYAAGSFTYYSGQRVQQTALAPWLPPAEAAELVRLTASTVPIVRGDWWFSRSAIQIGRKGTGYYDWLALKNRKDFEAMVSFNAAESQCIKREVAAIVSRSGVAQNPRQVFRLQALTGGYWFTKDVLTDNRNERNPLRQLDAELKHEAEEHYAPLANGLFAYFLSDDKGKRQDTAPDTIGPDTIATGKDKRIHIGLSCVRCHVEGLRPIDDWGRKVFSTGSALSSPDPAKLQRLRQLYLSELNEHLEDDRARNARVVKRLTGWTQEQAANAMAKAWDWYVERDLMPVDAARELGVTEVKYLSALATAAKENPLFDTVLASHLAKPPIGIRSDDWEQIYPLVAGIVRQP